MYSAKEVAQALGVGAAMLRRYAATYERISGDEVEIHKRDGRLFTQKQLDTLLAARAIVQRQDMSVDAALETVLRDGDAPLAVRAGVGAAVDTLAMVEALRTAVTDPLLSELQSIRTELAELKLSREEENSSVEVEKPSPKQEDKQHGLLVRLAMWVESLVRR